MSRKAEDGERYMYVCEVVSNGVTITSSNAKGDKKIGQEQFYEVLADSMNARLMQESEKTIVQCVNTLLPAAWPSTVPPEYGWGR